jgi:hypothetical protein
MTSLLHEKKTRQEDNGVKKSQEKGFKNDRLAIFEGLLD